MTDEPRRLHFADGAHKRTGSWRPRHAIDPADDHEFWEVIEDAGDEYPGNVRVVATPFGNRAEAERWIADKKAAFDAL